MSSCVNNSGNSSTGWQLRNERPRRSLSICCTRGSKAGLPVGTTLLIFGIRHAYAQGTAERELIKQYEFMARIFANARYRLDAESKPEQKRQILLALGKPALGEHAQWIMMYRDRSVDQTDIWRLGSGGG